MTKYITIERCTAAQATERDAAGQPFMRLATASGVAVVRPGQFIATTPEGDQCVLPADADVASLAMNPAERRAAEQARDDRAMPPAERAAYLAKVAERERMAAQVAQEREARRRVVSATLAGRPHDEESAGIVASALASRLCGSPVVVNVPPHGLAYPFDLLFDAVLRGPEGMGAIDALDAFIAQHGDQHANAPKGWLRATVFTLLLRSGMAALGADAEVLP